MMYWKELMIKIIWEQSVQMNMQYVNTQIWSYTKIYMQKFKMEIMVLAQAEYRNLHKHDTTKKCPVRKKYYLAHHL